MKSPSETSSRALRREPPPRPGRTCHRPPGPPDSPDSSKNGPGNQAAKSAGQNPAKMGPRCQNGAKMWPKVDPKGTQNGPKSGLDPVLLHFQKHWFCFVKTMVFGPSWSPKSHFFSLLGRLFFCSVFLLLKNALKIRFGAQNDSKSPKMALIMD